MAYAALVSLAQTSDRILSDHLFSICVHHKQKIVALYENTIILQEFLDKFPEKANTLEGRIRDIASIAESLIEYVMLKKVHPRCEWTHRQSKVTIYKYLAKVANGIESIAREVMDIKSSFKTDNVQVCDGSAAAKSSSSSSSRPASTAKCNDVVIGFDDDLLEIQDRLCGESSKLQVIPIYGMGGIGKTTLARNAYDDPLIIESFHIRAWITISQDYSAEKILSDLLESFKESNAERSGQSLEDKVYRSLKGRKYLIVMDDVWSTEVWGGLRNIFPDDGNGSRIMLTTRLLDVAADTGSSRPLYEMSLMDAHQSWNLSRQRVFKYQNCPPDLEDIGKKIARGCRGLPLAIVVIAGLLSTVSKTPTSWQEIAENVNQAVGAEHEQFEKILSLSYAHLPHHLRPCFLYMAGFQDNRSIRVSNLIKLWVAEGFLKQSDGSKSLEEEAEECLEDLIRRSLVLVIKRKTNNRTRSCYLHDLMWDLCIKKANEEKKNSYHRVWFDKTFPYAVSRERLRRLATSHSLPKISTFYGLTIHTIRCFNPTSLECTENFRLLRVLDLIDSCAYVFPAVLFELFHLRYFGMNYIGEIPAAISKLQNLQTLIIFNTGPLFLPREIWRMPRLRHILCRKSLLLDPKGTTYTLESLQTLSSLPFSMCNEGILKMIPNLKKLRVDCSSYRGGTCDLVCLRQLEKLTLYSSSYTKDWPSGIISFPRMLEKLTLSRMLVPWDEIKVVGSLQNLQVLKLRDLACKGRTGETSDGGFPQLEFLLIDDSFLEDWVTESSHFPSLKRLVLGNCRYLRDVPDGIGEIPTLEVIEVKGHVLKSLVESAKSIQEEQRKLWKRYASSC